MKLCFIAGANSIHSKRWIEYFTKKGHEIHWISLKPPTEGYVKNVKFYLIKGVILSSIINIKKLVRKIKPDILHIHYAGINGVIGALTGFHPLVLTVWGSDVLIAGKSKIKRPLVKFVLNKADLITCDAEHMKEAMVKLGVNPSKIKIVYFGIDTQKFSPRPKDKKIIQDLNPDNLPLVISLRNLEPVYDVGTLIKSIPLVLKEFSKVRFIIAGKGTEEKKLKNLAKNLKF
jgi:glycosyltransferase involved in cell wall biosynthesis